MSEAFFFPLSAMSSPSKSAKSLEEAPVPLQPSILWCVVWEKLLSGKVSQKISFWAPSSSVLCYWYVSRIANISPAKLWQAGACGSSDDLCLPPFSWWHVLASHSSADIPTPTVPALCKAQCSCQSLFSLLGLCWGRCSSWQRQPVPADPSGDHGTARLTGLTPGTRTAIVTAFWRKCLSFKSSLFWFDSETDTRPCGPDFTG